MPSSLDPQKWRQLPKKSFNSKDLAKRMKKAEGVATKHARRFVVKRWSNFREARRNVALWVLVMGLVVGATGLQFWWYQKEYTTTANATGGTYAEAVLGPVDTLNPIFAKSSAEESLGELMFSRLLTYDKTGSLNYDLAESMTLSDDKRTYTFKIRPDARWSDGRYVRAKDVAFTVKLLQNNATHATLTGWGGVSAKEVDEQTVAFELPGAYAAFPHALRSLPILPEHILRDVEPGMLRENAFSRNPVGSGPFKLRLLQDLDSSTGRKIAHLVSSESYYKGESKLSRIQLHVYKDTASIERALATSEVNAASDLSVTSAKGISSSHYIVDQYPVNGGVYALFNTSSQNLQDKNVRLALQVGTDTKSVREAVSPSLPQLDLPVLASQVSGDLPSAPTYDKDRAGQLLDEAGWKLDGSVRKKDGQALTLTIVTMKNPDYERALEVLQKQWQGLGITITTSIADASDPSQNIAQDVLQPRRYDVLLYQLAIGGDPDVYAYWHSSQASGGFNFSNYKNNLADEALLSARTRTEPALRSAKYVTFAKQWLSDAPAIGLYQATAQYVHTPSVHAADTTKTTFVSPIDRYSSVLYWTVGSKTVYKTP